MDSNKKPIISFKDLEIYRNTYKDSIVIMIKILPKLPESEKYDLKDQLSRSCKAIPRLIAEGYAKRHQKFGFQKYFPTIFINSLLILFLFLYLILRFTKLTIEAAQLLSIFITSPISLKVFPCWRSQVTRRYLAKFPGLRKGMLNYFKFRKTNCLLF